MMDAAAGPRSAPGAVCLLAAGVDERGIIVLATIPFDRWIAAVQGSGDLISRVDPAWKERVDLPGGGAHLVAPTATYVTLEDGTTTAVRISQVSAPR